VVVVNEKRVDLLVEDGRRHLAAEVVKPSQFTHTCNTAHN
jgi:hypothetical protein